MSKKVGKAISDFNMINEGDRVLVAVSGGKDSLSLLKILHFRKTFVPIDYTLCAIYVQSDYRCSGCIHKDLLEDFFKENGYAYHIEEIKIRSQARQISCFWCSWNRRKTIFTAAGKLGFNKVAFGHHKDDVAETILLNLFYQGEISAMLPRLDLFGGKLQIIRPLFYIEEDELRRFAKESDFPSQLCACPNSRLSKRRLIKEFIRTLQKECPNIKTNIIRSLNRVKKDYLIRLTYQEKPL